MVSKLQRYDSRKRERLLRSTARVVRKRRWLHALALMHCALGCGNGENVEPLPECASEGFVEYLHTFDKSRFLVGDNVVFHADPGVDRWVGDQGVFSIDQPHGVARGIMNANSSAFALPSLSPEERHDQEALDYFAGAGLPLCQLDGVQRWWDIGPTRRSQISVLRRAFLGIPIVESVASVRWNEREQSVSETVHWPRISRKVLEDAIRIREAAEVPQSPLLTAISNDLGPDFEVVGPAVRHSTAGSVESFFEVAVLQVRKDGLLHNYDTGGERVGSPNATR